MYSEVHAVVASVGVQAADALHWRALCPTQHLSVVFSRERPAAVMFHSQTVPQYSYLVQENW